MTGGDSRLFGRIDIGIKADDDVLPLNHCAGRLIAAGRCHDKSFTRFRWFQLVFNWHSDHKLVVFDCHVHLHLLRLVKLKELFTPYRVQNSYAATLISPGDGNFNDSSEVGGFGFR